GHRSHGQRGRQPRLGRGAAPASGLRRRHHLLPQRSARDARVEVAARRRTGAREDDRRESGRRDGDPVHADLHGLAAGPRPASALEIGGAAAHEKFAASSTLPLPLYFATWGYGQSGRVRTDLLSTTRAAGIVCGAAPFSTHSASGVKASKTLVPM